MENDNENHVSEDDEGDIKNDSEGQSGDQAAGVNGTIDDVEGRNFIKDNKMTLCKNYCDDQVSCQESITMENMNADMDADISFKSGMCENSKILCEDIFNINIVNDEEEIMLDINKNLKFNIQNRIYEIVKQTWCNSVESIDNYNDIHDFSMEIMLIKNEIVKTTPNRLPYMQVVELKKIIEDFMNRKVIQERSSHTHRL